MDVHSFTSANIVNRRVTLTLLDPGPLTAGPWLIAGDSVAQFTDTNGQTIFTNVLAGGYRLDIAGTPSRSFPFGMPDTNTIPSGVTTNVVGLIGATNIMPWFYTAAQIDAILATNYGTAAGTNVTVQTNVHQYTVNVPIDPVTMTTNANGIAINTNGPLNIGALTNWGPLYFQSGINDGANATKLYGVGSGTIDLRFPGEGFDACSLGATLFSLGVEALLAGPSNVSTGPFYLLGPSNLAPNEVFGPNNLVIGSMLSVATNQLTNTFYPLVSNPSNYLAWQFQLPTNTLTLNDQFLSDSAVGTSSPQTNFANRSITVSNLLLQLTQPFDTNQNFNENWYNLFSWAGSGDVALSNNALYAISGTVNPGGINWGFNLGTLGQARVRASLTVPAETGTQGYVLVALNTGTTNSVPAANIGGLWGCGIVDNLFGASGYAFMWATNGVYTVINTNIPAGRYDLCVFVDQTNISLSIIWPTGTNVEYVSCPRGSANFQNVECWNVDARTYSGIGIGPIGAHKGYSTILGSTNETRYSFAESVDNSAGTQLAAFWPPNYNAQIGAPLLIMEHGSGKTQDDILPNATNNANYFLGWITNGFIVASSFTHGSPWGSQTGVNDIHALVSWVKSHGAVREVVALGESAGFPTILNWVNQQVDSPPVCIIGLFPVCDQVPLTNSFWNVLTNSPAFPGLTNTGWNTVTAGYDPCVPVLGVNDPSRYQGVPICTHVSLSDNVVNWISNSVVFSNLVGNAVSEFTINTNAVGGHGDLSHFNFPFDWAFYQRAKTRYNYGGTIATTTHQ